MVVVTVPGMTCRHDVRRVSAHVADVGGVESLRVDPVTKTVTVHGDIPAEAVGAAILAAGYTVSEASA